MSEKPRQRKFHFKNKRPQDPAVKSFGDWLPENRGFYQDFRSWLIKNGYSKSSRNIYCVAVRHAIGFLDKPYWVIDPEADIYRFRRHLKKRPISQATRDCYYKGLKKLTEYLYLRCHKPPKPKQINWDHYLGTLPDWLATAVKDYVKHCRRRWLPEDQYRCSIITLSPTTLFFRWAITHTVLETPKDITVTLWYAYVDERLEVGIKPVSLNKELFCLKSLFGFLKDQGHLINERLLRVPKMKKGRRLPKDVPMDKLRLVLAEIENDAASTHAGIRRMGLIDKAAFYLMLHCGLRSCEVRHLKMVEIDWQGRRVRIEKSKGLKDRYVYLSDTVVAALQAYMQVRGPQEALPEYVFIYRHKPLSSFYFYSRLRTYARRCGVLITPHQLRHSCATLLLNAGAPAPSVQAILGHRWLSSTMRYARVYDRTVAADYYAAMALVERRLALMPESTEWVGIGPLLALVDSLQVSGLDEKQAETVCALQAGLLALVEQEKEMLIWDVKVPAEVD